MKKILLTGSTGFIGRSVLPLLQKEYEVFHPGRNELNLYDEGQVGEYIRNNKIDIVLHCANPRPVDCGVNKTESLLGGSLRQYFNLRLHSSLYEKMFYLGSGAEYDKSRDIVSVSEEEIGQQIPKDDYGFAKYIMNEDARKSDNIYNLRIFGCYGPTDAKTKFIRDSIDCCLNEQEITIRQNCYFDYMYVEDLGRLLLKLIPKDLSYHDYNVCSGKRITLKEIAGIVKSQMNNPYDIKIYNEGWNKEYTASNFRLLSEVDGFEFTTIYDGISKQIQWQRNFIQSSM